MASDGNGISSSGSGSDIPSAPSGVNAQDIERMINDALSKALGPRLKRERSSMEEMIAAKVAEALKASAPVDNASTEHPPEGGDIQSNKLNLKALDTRYKLLQDRVDTAERQAKEANERESQTRLRSDLQGAFSKYAGADNPHLPAYLNHYSSQFRHVEGQTYRVTKDDYGDEHLVPLTAAAESMFGKEGELKHLVSSKSPNLMPSSMARGMPMPASSVNQHPAMGLFEREIAHHQAMSDPAAYDALVKGR